MNKPVNKAKKQQRILVTVSPEMYELVQRLNTEANVATSALLGELLEEAKPVLEAMLMAVQKAKLQQHDAFDALQKFLIESQMRAHEAQLEILQSQQKLRRARTDKKD